MTDLLSGQPRRLPEGWRLSVRQFLIFQVALPLLVLGILFKAFTRILPLTEEHTSLYLTIAFGLLVAALVVAVAGFALTHFDPGQRRRR